MERRGEILIYQTPDGSTRVDVKAEDETVWLSLNQMAALFQKAKSTVSEHIRNIYAEGELEVGGTVRKYRSVGMEGKREVAREIEYYNLDVIISVGYRVKSHVGTHFRIWATQHIREFIIKGFVMDDERLKHTAERVGPRLLEDT